MSPLFATVRRAALLWVPFAAVFAAGTTLSPNADAQYPGGSYPGGGSGGGSGSYPGGLAPGWSVDLRPGTTGQYLSDPDWTGLNVTRTANPFPSSTLPPSTVSRLIAMAAGPAAATPSSTPFREPAATVTPPPTPT